MSVDSVEALTGYDFFTNVADSAENAIEALVDKQRRATRKKGGAADSA